MKGERKDGEGLSNGECNEEARTLGRDGGQLSFLPVRVGAARTVWGLW